MQLADTRITRADLRLLLPFWALMLLWNILSWSSPFFWDNILNAKIATWYLSTGFESLFVPESLDAGHPPFFSLYLAGIWSLLGKSLWVSHLAMLPFLLGAQTLLFKVAKGFLPRQALPLAMALFFVEPCLLAQGGQVTPDMALLCFYLLALVGILEGRSWWVALGMLGMGMCSFRGILMFAAVGLTDLFWAWSQGQQLFTWKRLWPYVLAILALAAWLWGHSQAVGWMVSPPETTYGGHRKFAGVGGILRNAGIIIWRLIDHGRVFLWALVAWGVWRTWRHRRGGGKSQWMLLGVGLIPVLVLGGLFVLFTNPVGHRYFMVAYLLLGLIGVKILWSLKPRPRLLLGTFVTLGLASGHFWVYPEGIAKGWDATLAHLPYHAQNQAVRTWLDQQGIPRHDVCTAFPVLAADAFLDPADPDTTAFSPVDENMAQCNWVLYTNVANGFSDGQIDALKAGKDWEPIWKAKGGAVETILFLRHANHFRLRPEDVFLE